MTQSIGSFLYAIALILSWVGILLHVLDPRAMPYTRGAERVIHRPGARKIIALIAGSGVAILLTLLFAVGWNRLVVGVTYLVFIGAGRQWVRAQWQEVEVVELGKYVPAPATLLGYVVGSGIATWLDHPRPDWAGWQAACGVLGACFTLSALSKFKKARWKWFSGVGIQLLVAERALLTQGWRRRLRERVSTSVPLTTCMAGGAFLLEFCGFLFLVPELRIPFLAGGVSMFGGFALFLGYAEPEWVLVLTALTLLSI